VAATGLSSCGRLVLSLGKWLVCPRKQQRPTTVLHALHSTASRFPLSASPLARSGERGVRPAGGGAAGHAHHGHGRQHRHSGGPVRRTIQGYKLRRCGVFARRLALVGRQRFNWRVLVLTGQLVF
jgi:hypothetical protein